MSVIRIGHGAIIVERPEQRMLDELRRFRRDKDGTGEYEDLFMRGHDGAIVTPPGFLRRIRSLCSVAHIRDGRVPVPDPDMSGLDRFDAVTSFAVRHALETKDGGIISVPACASDRIVGGIVSAFPQGPLCDRGTPLTVVVTKDRESARALLPTLQTLLPGRIVSKGYGDDVAVVSYQDLGNIQLPYVGLLVCILDGTMINNVAESVSPVRNALRFGIHETPDGGEIDVDLREEGLFGPLVAHVKYDDYVSIGKAAQITVCWIDAPTPGYLGDTNPESFEAKALQNDRFIDLVAGIARKTRNDVGCICKAGSPAIAKRLSERLPDVVNAMAKIPAKERRPILEDIASGEIRKAIVPYGSAAKTRHGVFVMAACGDAAAGKCSLPLGRPQRPGERIYVVDFRHSWDYHNGRPGYLALKDMARMRAYKEMRLGQIMADADHLPFIG